MLLFLSIVLINEAVFQGRGGSFHGVPVAPSSTLVLGAVLSYVGLRLIGSAFSSEPDAR
jgi:hypothetical protein